VINWRNFRDEQPKNGQQVFCLGIHWKLNFPGSFRIYGGTVEKNYFNNEPVYRVATDDDFGEGCWSVDLVEDYQGGGSESASYWIPASELNVPSEYRVKK